MISQRGPRPEYLLGAPFRVTGSRRWGLGGIEWIEADRDEFDAGNPVAVGVGIERIGTQY